MLICCSLHVNVVLLLVIGMLNTVRMTYSRKDSLLWLLLINELVVRLLVLYKEHSCL